jgi:hypothetical protein
MKTVLPAGKYWIGDPCYVIDGEEWSNFLDPYWNIGGFGGVFSFEEYEVCAFQTQWGDGCYPASNGVNLGVDAGIIGAIPIELARCGDLGLGTEVTFDQPFACHRDPDGRMHFGSFSVMTGDENNDEDDYCEECGR